MSAPCPRLGFRARLELAPTVTSQDEEALTLTFLEFLGTFGLNVAGSKSNGIWSSSIWREGSQATEQDREALRAWVNDRDEFTLIDLGDIVDLSDDD